MGHLSDAIAIVGLAGRFPGAATADKLWRNICEGRNTISRFELNELEDAFSAEERREATFVPARSIIEGAETFDAAFFGMKPREAELTDPQQRIFLEICWEALEDAGYRPSSCPQTGVFAGASLNTYLLRHVLQDRAAVEDFTSQFQIGRYGELIGSLTDFLASRVSYKLGLSGPSMSVSTACSTSLTATALACQSLLLQQCDMALAGGVSITFPQRRGYSYLEGGIGSPDGTCRPYEAQAAGTVFGHGAGVVVLKRYEDAERDGDNIYAVILGSAINNDGAGKVGFTAPSVEGQAAAMSAAYAMAGIDPATVSYVEGHGTATPLGDPIEVAALNMVLGGAGPGALPCHLGSVKGNVGHLDAAAGVTGLIKVALALRHRKIPPLAHFEAPNPLLDLSGSRLVFDKTICDWDAMGHPRRGAVNALGVGGTNVHVVLEEAPERPRQATSAELRSGTTQRHILAISAKSQGALVRQATNLADALSAPEAPELADAALTLRVGRETFSHRLAVAASSRDEAVKKLREAARRCETASGRQPGPAPRPVLMFPGQGTQHPGMGRGLYDACASFRKDVDRGIALASELLGQDLRRHLFPATAAPEHGEAIRSTVLAQPALFVVEHALATTLIQMGLRPAAMIGHSLGEFVAATIAGVMSYENALEAITGRAKLMAELPGGAMLAVRLGADRLQARLPAGADIAAINGKELSVASGPVEAIEALARALERDDVSCRRLHTSHAFHSTMMDPAVPKLLEIMRAIKLEPPQIPIASTVTGTWLTDERATSPSYWAEHCRAPVRFADALATAMTSGNALMAEIGPGSTLTSLVLQATHGRGDITAVHTLPGPDRETGDELLADARAAIWAAGVDIDCASLPQAQAQARRVSLPPYPFDRKRYFLDVAPLSGATKKPFSEETMDAFSSSCNEVSPNGHTIASSAATRASVELNLASSMATAAGITHRDKLASAVVEILALVTGEDLSSAPPTATFLELGFDSLLLGQIAQRINKTYKVNINFRQLMSSHQTIDAVVDFLEAKVAPEATTPASEALAVPPAVPAAIPSGGVVPGKNAASEGLEGLFRDQLAAIQQVIAGQLAALAQMPAGSGSVAMPTAPHAASTLTSAKPTPELPAPTQPDRFNTFMVKGQQRATTLSARQREFIDDLAARLEAKMPGSKAYTQRYRKRLADPRAASSFDERWKELVYPIVSDRADGSQIWDIDGNSYIDVVNGFGQTAFGHNPPFVREAIERQLKDGYPIGPQAHLAGEVTELICEMTGNERATFCNTGSEAVMAAMRVARAVTGRDKIVFFAGDYHGQFDEVLAKPGRQRSLPIAPGIPDSSLENIVILPYGAPESLEWIKKNAHVLAAVLVEPVQSRKPSLQPREFIVQLRAATEASGTALVFDEVVTGFRAHAGGMQAVYGIRADMATYGKVLGGGLPIGILAGKAKFLDALDGGQWAFGDDTVPEVAPTFFAGTFVRHPLALAAARAVLVHLRDGGMAELDKLSQRTADLARLMNADLAAAGVAARFEQFASWLWFAPTKETPLASLFFPHMRLLGIHVQDGFPWFMTTAHSAADFDRIAGCVGATTAALVDAEILSTSPAGKTAAAATPERPVEAAAAPATGNIYPSAPMREVYLAAQLGPVASTAFNEGLTLQLDGELDVAALKATCADVVNRHQALRASLGPTGETVRIAPRLDLSIPLVDVSGEARPGDQLSKLVLEDQGRPFDLENGPLIRMQLVRLEAKSHALVVCGHHIVLDGWSAGVLIGELAETYNAYRNGRHPDLPEPAEIDKVLRPIAGAGSKTESYWLERFKSPPEPLELPTDRPRPERKTFRGATVTHHIGRDLQERIKRFSRTNGVSAFATMLAGLQCLLARLTQQSDICVAVPMAGQQLEDGQALVGHLVNFLPVRVDVDPGRSPAAQVQQVRDVLIQSYEHQDYTLGRLVERLGMPRRWDRTPIADVQFNLESELADPGFAGLVCQASSNPKTAVNFDLFFNLVETQNGIRAEIDYCTDLFDEATVKRWAGHLTTMLDGMTRDAELRTTIGALPILTAAEIEWLRDGVNKTERPIPTGLLLHEMISGLAATTPGAPALVHGDRRMSRGELEAAAQAVARRLEAALPQPGARIAIAVDRSCELVAVLLGVWKAGHTFVPLDPTHPVTRLGQTMGAGDVAAVIASDARILDVAPIGAKRIDVRELTDKIGSSGTSAVVTARKVAQETAAYVMFTSGSTGTPKGVEVSHRSLVNFMTSMLDEPGLSERDTLLAVTTVCFDIAMLELFLPLLAGGRVVIADRNQVVDGFALVERLKSGEITAMQATPALWRTLLEAGFKPGLGIKMLAGGEALPRDLANKLLATGGELWNLYGPTETTIWSALDRVSSRGTVTVGRPIANTSLVIVDENGQVAPIGVEGELLIGGAGLAIGYLGRPELTEAAFRTLAPGGGPARRYYRTGDMAVRLLDGRVVIKGRRDQQIKLRGFRVELEEIETVLRSAAGVSTVAVSVVTDKSGAERLSAAYVVKPGAEPADSDLAKHARTRLPEYMVPTLWQRLGELPLTANGKLDRKSLRAIANAHAAHHVPGATPHRPAQPTASSSPDQTENERTISSAWAEILGSVPGPHENFLELGIDSLRVFRVVAQLRRAGLTVTAQQIFEQPTVAGLAASLSATRPHDKAATPFPKLSSYGGGQRRVGRRNE